MATAFGADPLKNAAGAVVTGTTSADLRKIMGAMYTPGLVKGGVITPSTSTMSYRVNEGVGVIKMSDTENVIGYWPAVNALVPTNLAVPRTDYVYAYQKTPGADNDANLVVMVGNSLPSTRAVLLGTFTYKAGATSSRDAVVTTNVDWSIPYGSSLGILAEQVDTLNGLFTTRSIIANRSFYLPTDRRVRFHFNSVVRANSSVGFSNTAYTEASYGLNVDGNQIAYWRSPGLHQAWSTLQFETAVNLTAGQHVVTLSRGREIGPGTPFQIYGQGSTPGAVLTVTDDGVVK